MSDSFMSATAHRIQSVKAPVFMFVQTQMTETFLEPFEEENQVIFPNIIEISY